MIESEPAMDQNIKTSLDDDGVLSACIDMPGRSMNVFSLDMMDSLERLVMQVEADDKVRAVVLSSGKPAFMAGADLAMIRMFTERARTDSHAQLVELCGRLGRIFRRMEKCTKPFVAAVNGLALGGGLEVSLACHARVVADEPAVLLGLPEIKLGLLPGAGGTQRLPRLIGVQLGLRMLLQGNPLKPAEALECGLIDEVVKPDELLAAAKRKALSIERTAPPWDREGASFDSGALALDHAGADQRIAAALGLPDALIAKYPAYKAIMHCVIEGWTRPMDEALAREMDIFVGLIRNPVAGNMVRSLFLDRQRSLKAAPTSLDPRKARVAVIGEGAEAVAKVLAAGKAQLVAPAALSTGDVAVCMGGAKGPLRTAVRWLADAGDTLGDGRVGVWVSAKTEHGCAVEVVCAGDDAAARDAGLVVAKWLRAESLLETRGNAAFLQQLSQRLSAARDAGCSEDEQLLAMSLFAIRRWLDGAIDDVELADSAAVVAGLAPAYSGGPFAYAAQQGLDTLRRRAAQVQSRDAAMFAWPTGAESLFAAAAA